MANIVQVVALEPGHDGRVYRVAGERFSVDLDDGRFKGATWFSKPEDVPPPKPAAKDKRPPGAGPAKGSALNADPAPGEANPNAANKSGEF